MNLLKFLNPFRQSETKRFHEITKLGGEYSPLGGFRTSALNLSESYTGWVYTSVSTIANNVAKLPFHLLDDRDKQIDHEYLKLLSYDLFEAITSYLKLRGTCYIWKNTIGAKVRSLHILHPDYVTPKWDKNKSEVVKYEYMLNGKTITFDKKEIIEVMNFNPTQAYPYIVKGTSDIQASALSVDTERAQSLYNWKTFENGANPGGVISTDKDLDQTQVDRMTTGWNNKFKGVNNAQKLAILTQGATFTPVSMSPQDMAYIEGKRLTRDEILAIFKVPKAVLGIGEGSGGNMNIRNFQEIFMRNAVEPVAMKISDAFNRQLFNGIGRFEFYNIIPQDENVIRSDYQGGILTLNEARAFRGMSPVKDGDKFIYDDTTAIPTATTVIQDTTEEKIMTRQAKRITPSLKSMLDDMAESMIPNSEKAMILKVKRRDKRLTKYEKQIEKVVADIAKQQESEILAGIKDTKSLSFPKLDFSKYKATWLMRLSPALKALVKEEADNAIREVGSKISFNVGSPEVSKQIKTNVFLMSKSIDGTTKELLEKVFEKSITEGLGAEATKDLVKEQFAILSDSRATAIARTETVRMANEASILGWKETGVVEAQQWWTALDDRVSDICSSLHGKKIPLGDNFFDKGDTLTTPKGSYGFDYADVGGPPSHPNCRCTLIPITQ